ncbi:MAG: T9SS type A sorting domain-containing protein [Bacteroidota bacterium]
MSLRLRVSLFCLFLFLHNLLFAQINTSILYETENGCLEYISDKNGNRIPDFSYAGCQIDTIVRALWRNSESRSIAPIEGDNTQHLQVAIDSIAELPLDANGFRGHLILEAGVYEIAGTIRIPSSGIVLAGVGNQLDSSSNTILRAIGNTPDQRDVLIMGHPNSKSWKSVLPQFQIAITNEFLAVNSRSIQVADLNQFQIGQTVIIRMFSTQKWLDSINGGDTDSDEPWKVGDIDRYYQRKVIAIDTLEQKLILDVPIYDHFDNELTDGIIYPWMDNNLVEKSGIENLHIEIETEGEETENHAWNGIRLDGVENCWVKEVVVRHFGYAAIYTTKANYVTVENCEGLAPHSLITGARRYNFAANAYSNNILFTRCRATEGRHSFVSNGTSSVSGVVWHRCTSTEDYSTTEGHRRWSQALLFDKIDFKNFTASTILGLHNRGRFGTGHGWAAVHSVAWNVTHDNPGSRIVIQQPPGRQNYGIACRGRVTNQFTFTHPLGYVEASNSTEEWESLYETQLRARLENGTVPDAPARLKIMEEDGKIFLRWLDIAATENQYVVEYALENEETYTTLTALPANSTELELPTVSAIRKYRVYATNDNCKSAYSNVVTDTEITTSTTGALDDTPLLLFPNPFSSQIFLKKDKEIKQIIITNSVGKVLHQFRSVPTEISTKNWTNGIYFFKIEKQDGQIYVQKMIK